MSSTLVRPEMLSVKCCGKELGASRPQQLVCPTCKAIFEVTKREG